MADGGKDSETATDKGINIVLELENFIDALNAVLALLDRPFISFRSIRFQNVCVVKLARGTSNERIVLEQTRFALERSTIFHTSRK